MKEKVEISELVTSIENNSLVACLEVIRQPLFRLSDFKSVGITKALYYQWQKQGIIRYNTDTNSNDKFWKSFSLLDYVILQIIKTLWSNDYSTDKIKDVLKVILDGKGLKLEVEDILISNTISNNASYENNPSKDLLHYVVNQFKQNPSLPYFTRLESYIIGSFKIDRPFSLIIWNSGRVEMFTTDSLYDQMGGLIINEMFSKTFINISIKKIIEEINNIEDGEDAKSNVFSTTNIIEKLMEKGYSSETINELFSNRRNDLEFKEETIENPKSENIQNLLRQHASQDVLIKVRDGEKKSIRRIIINKRE